MRPEFPHIIASLILGMMVSAQVSADILIRFHGESGEGNREVTAPYVKDMRLAALNKILIPEVKCSFSAQLLRPSLKNEQERIKKGLLYDLRQLEYQAGQAHNLELAEWSHNLSAQVKRHKVTGRLTGIHLNPLRAELDLKYNPVLMDGDILDYRGCQLPIGAVDESGIEALSTQNALRVNEVLNNYLPRASWQAPGYLWQVQPDGSISRIRVGYWSSSRTFIIGNGGFVFRPLKEQWNERIGADFNYDLAQWLATQHVEDVTGVPR